MSKHSEGERGDRLSRQTTVFFRLDPVLGRYLDLIAMGLEGDDVQAASTALAVGVHEMLRRLGRYDEASELRRYMFGLDPGREVVWGVAVERRWE